MRLKLVLVCSLLSAIVGAGATAAIILLGFSTLKPASAPGFLAVLAFLLPVLATLLAAVFVYRHTARRRRLQAALTVVISVLLTVGMLLALAIVFEPIFHNHEQPPSDSEPVN